MGLRFHLVSQEAHQCLSARLLVAHSSGEDSGVSFIGKSPPRQWDGLNISTSSAYTLRPGLNAYFEGITSFPTGIIDFFPVAIPQSRPLPPRLTVLCTTAREADTRHCRLQKNQRLSLLIRNYCHHQFSTLPKFSHFQTTELRWSLLQNLLSGLRTW